MLAGMIDYTTVLYGNAEIVRIAQNTKDSVN